MQTTRIIEKDGSITEIVDTDPGLNDRVTAMLAELETNNMKRNLKINMAESFRRMAAYYIKHPPTEPIGCGSEDSALSRYEELRLINHDKE